MAQTKVARVPVVVDSTALENSSIVTNAVEISTLTLASHVKAPRTIFELICTKARLARDQPILGYPRKSVDYVEYTYGQIHDFTHVAARQLSAQLPLRHDSSAPERVVAVLGPSSLDYLITALALSSLGFTVLILSIKIPAAAHTSLLDQTGCSHICIDPSLQEKASTFKSQMPNLTVLNIVSQSQYEVTDKCGMETARQERQLNLSEECDKIAWVVHSSGSTGLPKPIYQTHAAALRSYENNMNMEGFITLPLSHAHGLSTVFRAFTSQKKIFMYSAGLSLTRSNLLQVMHKHSFEIFYGAPHALKLLSESEEGIRMLTRMKVVIFGGSACPNGIGDLLVENGVNLISHYSTAEVGQLMTSFRPVDDKAWSYLRVPAALVPHARFEERDNGLFELVVLKSWPWTAVSNRDDGAYVTNDLFKPHHTIQGAWHFCGRLDDTITLINGEKVDPVNMEMAMRQQLLVKDAVIFGTDQARLSMMVVASDAAASLDAADVIDSLWPIIKAENETCLARTQIAREMICLLPSNTAYPQTDEGVLIRQAFYQAFANQIEAMYHAIPSSSQEMTALVTKYGRFPQHVPVSSRSDHKIVVVTGATGFLGAHVVAQLVIRNDISEVCCLVRAPCQQMALRRTFKSLADRAVLHSLPLKARRKICAYPSNLAKTDLGLDIDTLEHITSRITCLIHCAWSASDGKCLSSFEDDCIAGARNLMLLCLAAKSPEPASFNFCSSMATVAQDLSPVVLDSLPPSLASSRGTGYAQSKMVTEQIIAKAVEQTGMAAHILRLGPIVADSTHGVWNDTEAFPMLLKAAVSIGAFPKLNMVSRWLPVDVVAGTINRISLSTNKSLVLNVVNPNPFHWTRDLLPRLEKEGLLFDHVEPCEWIRRIRQSESDVAACLDTELLRILADQYGREPETIGGPMHGNKAASSIPKSIRNYPALSQDLVSKFVQNFPTTSWAVGRITPAAPSRQVTLIVLAGPCGSGKSSVASDLADRLCCPSIEGDSIHDAIAVAKMSNGVPLTSLDREIWLARVKTTILERVRAAHMFNAESIPKYIILTCSALKQEHRAALRHLLRDGTIYTQFVLLEASEDELVRRVDRRKGHYMKSNMVRSQLMALEAPSIHERDMLPIDTEKAYKYSLTEEICEILGYQ